MSDVSEFQVCGAVTDKSDATDALTRANLVRVLAPNLRTLPSALDIRSRVTGMTVVSILFRNCRH